MRRPCALSLFCVILVASAGCASETQPTGGQSPGTDVAAPVAGSSSTQPPPTSTSAKHERDRPLFTQIGSISQRADLIGNEHAVFVVDEKASGRSITSYTPTGELLGAADFPASDGVPIVAGCSVQMVGRQGVPSIVTLTDVEVPPAGIKPGQDSYSVTVFDGSTMSQVWTKQIYTEESGEAYLGCGNGVRFMSTTEDGKWILVSNGPQTYVIDAKNGDSRTLQGRAAGAGNYIVSFDEGQRVVTGLDPETLAVLYTAATTGSPYNDDAAREFTTFISGESPTLDGRTYVTLGAEFIYDLATGSVSRGPNFTTTGVLSSTHMVLEPETRRAYVDGAAYDLTSNTRMWAQNEVNQLCGASAKSVLVRSGFQLASLDAATGEQTEYTSALDTCDPVFGKYMYIPSDSDESTDIYQVLK